MLETTAATPARPPSRPPSDADGELDFDWRPEPLGRAIDSDRTFRWPIVIASLFIGVSVALIIRLFIASPADSAAARLDQYRDAATSLDAALRTVLEAPPGDPAAADALEIVVADLRALLAEPLPGDSPFFGGGSVADLEAAHQRLTPIIDSAETIARDLRLAATYREASIDMLALPLLPTEVPPELIDPAARTLADFRASASAAAATLDDSAAFAGFRQRVGEINDLMPSWSDRYLLALRREDVAATTDLLGDMQARFDLARAELNAALQTLRDGITAGSLAVINALQQAQLVD
jgi:hypothetical protein